MYGNCTRVKRVLRVNIHERYCSTATHEISLSQTPDISNLIEIKIKGAWSRFTLKFLIFSICNPSKSLPPSAILLAASLILNCAVFSLEQNILHYLGYIISHCGDHVWQTVRSRRGLSMTCQWRDLLEYSMTPEENLKIQTVYLSISTNVGFIKKRMQGLKKYVPSHISDLTACISQLRQKQRSTNLYNWFSRNLLVN